MEEAKWRFASNGNAGYTGINDSGIETFSAQVMHSLVRETIQNALDARKDPEKPIEVEFKEFSMSVEDFPGRSSFSKSIHACLDDNEDEDAKKFFQQAVDKIDGNEGDFFKVLRVSDFNTVGLQGAETGEKGSNWSRLVKEKGSSNKNKTAQGSFGIGKSAPFACSDFRTVFYSSLYEKEDGERVESNIGVARLISFKNDAFKTETNEGWTTGMGFYSDNDQLKAILKRADFDPSFNRTTSGTDIYIMGFTASEDFEGSVKTSVLRNFLVSIWKGLLTVRINGSEISKDTLQKYVWELPSDEKENKELKEYYDLLTRTDRKIVVIPLKVSEYGEKYGFKDGECELRLKEGNDLNSRILLTRRSGMRLFEQDHISGSIKFTGVLLMNGANMNAAFRKMEVPSHDAWAPDRIKDSKEKRKAKQMLDDFKKYLRKCVKDSFGHTDEDSLSAFGMAEFLPSDKKDQEAATPKETIGGDIDALVEKTVSVPKEKVVTVEKAHVARGEGEEGTNIKIGEHSGHGHGGGKHPLGGDDGNIPAHKYKEIAIQARVRSSDPRKGKCYVEYMAPKKSANAKLELFFTNERGKANKTLCVYAAKVVEGSADVKAWKGNEILLSHVKKNEKIRIECDVNINRYCMMEAVYYEDKK